MSENLRQKFVEYWGGEDRIPDEVRPILDELEQVQRDIAQADKHTQQLKESLTRYRHIVEQAADVMVIVDNEGYFEYANPMVELLTGYRPAELMGQSLFKIVPEAWAAKVEAFYHEQLEQVEERLSSLTLEFPILTKGGRERWVEQSASLLFDEGAVTGIEASLRDITERREAEESLRKQRRLFAGLVEVARAISEGLSLDTVLQSALDVSTELTEAEHGSLFLFSENGEISRGLAARGEHLTTREREAADFAMEMGLAGWAVRRNQAVLIEDVNVDERWIDYPEMPYQARSVLVTPIFYGNKLKGILTLTHSRPGSFQEEHRQLMIGAAQHMSLALHNAQLYEDQKRLANHQAILYETLRAVGEHLEIEVILRTAVETIHARTDWPMVTIFLSMKEADDRVKLTIQAKSDWELIADDNTLATNEGVIGRSYQSGLTQLVNDVLVDKDYMAGYRETRAELAVPMRRGGQIFGVLDVQSDIPNAFSPDDVLLADSLAETIALALENANLFEEIQETAERLREVDQLKSSFLAHVSHEIRTPMNAVIGMANLLDDTHLTFEQREYVESIRVSGEGLLAIINDILDITKIEANKLEIECIPLRVNRIIDEVYRMLAPVAAEKNLMLRCSRLDDDEMVVNSDRSRIKQILVNLIGNAIKFTEQGQIDLKVTAQPLDENTCELQFVVVDTGLGIPADSLEEIFEPFNQLGQRSVDGGTGLGLAISRRLAELMGGRIWAESEIRHGSKFYFYLPVELVPASAFSPSVPVAQVSFAGLAQKAPRSILIAEDNVVNQRVLLRTLENMGYQPAVVSNGQDVLKVVVDYDYDVILMDVQMPVMNGIEATRRIRSELPQERQPRIVGITAHAMADDRERCLSAGMDAYIQKPFALEELVAAFLDGLPDLEAPSQQSVAAVNDAELTSLKQFVGGADDLLEIIEVFIDDVPDKVDELKRAAAEQDAERLWQTAHSLKSSCASLGAMALSEMCRQIELLGKENRLDPIEPILKNMDIEYPRVLAALETYKKTL